MKKPLIKLAIVVIISIGIVCISAPLHEIGHWIGSMLFYHVNGTITFFYFRPDSNVGVYCDMMGGLFASICILPFLFLKINRIIKLPLLLTFIAHLSAFITEGFLQSYYNTTIFLIIGIILLVSISSLYIWFNRKLFSDMLSVKEYQPLIINKK